MNNIKLYHFTTRQHLLDIMRNGISKGEVATSPISAINAPCFTTNDNFNEQGWADGSLKDKLQVRITIQLEEGDPNLITWNHLMKTCKASRPWIEYSQSLGWYDTDAWYVYLGVLLPNKFKVIHYDA